MAKNELAVMENFDLQTLGGDLAEAISEELDGLGTIPFDRVKIPSGGGLAFEVPGEDENNPETASDLTGVILHHHPVNAYWKDKFEGGNEPPDCSSADGKVGIVRETGECKSCATCPYNQFGSDGTGKACKNVHRVYMLREGNPVPLILSLPPTSLKYMRDYIAKRILLKGIRCYDAVTKITLKKEKSSGGITYSRAAFTFVGKLTPEQAAQAKAMAEQIKSMDASVEVNDDDYASQSARPKVDENGFMNVPDEISEELPFN
ncbi:MAG: hypothetical protein LUG61_01525 [Lachnospiraceae bacterium]|nr:hypothetical protein [Lachnospiraceae bacterium]